MLHSERHIYYNMGDNKVTMDIDLLVERTSASSMKLNQHAMVQIRTKRNIILKELELILN